jgi:hypothetical protein
MTHGQDYGQPMENQPWQPQQYDPVLHQQRIEGQWPPYPLDQPWPPTDESPWTPQERPPQEHDWPQPAYRRSWPARHKLLTGLIAFASLAVIIAIARPGIGNSPEPTVGGAAVTNAAAAAVASDCATQARNWANGSGPLIDTFTSDMGTFGTASQNFTADLQTGGATAGDVSAVQSAASAIQSDAESLEADPGPSCLPGLRPALSAAARDYSEAAIDANNGMDQYTAGSLNAATGDIDAAGTAMDMGNAKLAAATTAVKNFNSEQGG